MHHCGGPLQRRPKLHHPFRQTMFSMAQQRAASGPPVLPVLIVMLGCSLPRHQFTTACLCWSSTCCPLLHPTPNGCPRQVRCLRSFAANRTAVALQHHALQYGIVIAVLESAGVAANVNLIKFLSSQPAACHQPSWCGASLPTRSCRTTPLPRPRKALTPVSRRSLAKESGAHHLRWRFVLTPEFCRHDPAEQDR